MVESKQALTEEDIALIDISAQILKKSDAILITSGAGMGVDSGLPDFRGNEGFWKAYPYFAKVDMQFQDAACPKFFKQNPSKFWFFYGHRYTQYRDVKPHQGFDILLELAKSDQFQDNYFVFTSNVDGQFQKAGFSEQQIVECHGNIFHFQCDKCGITEERKWDQFELDEVNYESKHLPKCKLCQEVVRPNIMMFEDYNYIPDRKEVQEQRYLKWIEKNQDKSLVIVEIGAGLAIPHIRQTNEKLFKNRTNKNTWFIRINPTEQRTFLVEQIANKFNSENIDLSKKTLVQLKMGAKNALQLIQDSYNKL